MVKKRVIVGMSGGMDSSVAAALLKHQNFDVIGLTMKFFKDRRSPDMHCMSNVKRAKSIAERLDIDHMVLDLEDCFRENVIIPFAEAYLSGKTPNPCVTCNKAIKFRILLQKADEIGADLIATGHYAKVEKDEGGRVILRKPRDLAKDQTYFLYRLNQGELARTIFPLGDISRQDVSKMAKALDLGFDRMRSSQDICFIPDRDYSRFLKQELGVEEKVGYIVDTDGKVMGKHCGIHNYTIGQRKKLGLSGGPYYVVSIDHRQNKIVVGRSCDLYHTKFVCIDPAFVDGSFPDSALRAMVKIRYQHKPDWATIEPCGGNRLNVIFDSPQRAITPGQSAVFYTEDGIVIGGATIDSLLE